MPLRVLHLYAGNLYGGVETLLRTLAEQRASNGGMQPAFALTSEGRLASELRACGAELHVLPAARVRYPWTVARTRFALRRLLKAERYDVAVCHSPWPLGLFGSTLRRAHTPFVFFQHDIARGTHWVERWAKLKEPDAVISNSHFSAKSAVKLFPKKTPRVVHCPVPLPSAPVSDVEKRRAVRQKLDTAEGDVVILQASRMERWKGLSLLVESLGHLRTRTPWTVWIAGGAQREHEKAFVQEVRARAEASGVATHLRWLGQRSDVPELMAAADVFCQPNLSPEPFGIVFIEALARGLPVVSTTMGAAMEIVTDACGVLVEPRPQDLASALTRLIDDGDARRALGTQGPERASSISDPAQQMACLESALLSVLRRPPN